MPDCRKFSRKIFGPSPPSGNRVPGIKWDPEWVGNPCYGRAGGMDDRENAPKKFCERGLGGRLRGTPHRVGRGRGGGAPHISWGPCNCNMGPAPLTRVGPRPRRLPLPDPSAVTCQPASVTVTCRRGTVTCQPGVSGPGGRRELHGLRAFAAHPAAELGPHATAWAGGRGGRGGEG